MERSGGERVRERSGEESMRAGSGEKRVREEWIGGCEGEDQREKSAG